ncbi:helix-turn-helix domain-containing protein [Pumilibacter muris]|uniref:helix-turn-helix domain-containing protein n=1 Tax=Pumilibacter muris TaxID=2941510 RepID=UPI00203EB7B7|nr:helix-turn-helix transcriptional regulator [Pumilibacter muris]
MINQFSKRIRELRGEKNITQKELAVAVGVLERTVSYLEQGKRECDFDTLIQLAQYFNITTDYLLGIADL